MQTSFAAGGFPLILIPISIIAAIVLGILAACKKVRWVLLFIPVGVGLFSIVAYIALNAGKIFPESYLDDSNSGPSISDTSEIEYVIYETDTWDGTSDTSWYTEGGKSFYIDTAEQFAGISKLARQEKTFAGVKISLRVNMDMGGNEWVPINEFEGTLQGNGATISNFTVNSSVTNYYHGLFAEQRGTIRNLHLRDFTVKGKYDVGALAATNSGVLENCSAIGKVSAERSFTDTDGGTTIYVGGLVGINSGIIKNCYTGGTVQASSKSQYMYVKLYAHCGGIAASNSGMIERTYSLASVTASTEGTNSSVGCYSYAGGICSVLTGTIKDSFAGGEVYVVVDVYQFGRDFGAAIGGVYARRSGEGAFENTYVLEGQVKTGVLVEELGTQVTVDPVSTLSGSEIEERLGISYK